MPPENFGGLKKKYRLRREVHVPPNSGTRDPAYRHCADRLFGGSASSHGYAVLKAAEDRSRRFPEHPVGKIRRIQK